MLRGMRRILVLFAPLFLSGQTVNQPVRAVTDPGIITTRQAITPAGVPSVFQGRVYGAAWGEGDELWVLHASDLYRLDWKKNEVKERVAHGGTPGPQAIQFDAASGTVFAANGGRSGSGGVKSQLAALKQSSVNVVAKELGSFLPGGLAVGRDVVVVPLTWENKLAVIGKADGKVLHRVETGVAPFASVVNAAGTVAFVSNLGGRPPKGKELFASPIQKPAERVTVDARGIASTGTVARVDLTTGQATLTIATGLHPTGMAWHEGTQRLYVANGNSESVTVIDTKTNLVVQTIPVQPFSEKVRGIAPTAVAVDPTGKMIYVACGGINAVAVIEAATGRIAGLMPTGWYPNGLAMHPGGKHLAVTSLLGPGSAWRDAPSKRFVHSYRGSAAVIELPDAAQLANYTTAVAENNHLRLAGAGSVVRVANPRAKPIPVPVRSGEPSLIEHVVYVVKENRTYDQVLGDISKGNGDPSLVMFGRDVTPNQHKLAEEFVLLDNFFATGGNSADGHQWVTQANEVEYCLWPGYQGRSYPFDGSDPMAYASGGFIWDYALAKGKSVKVYGEYAGSTRETYGKTRAQMLEEWKAGVDFTKRWNIKALIEPLNKILAANFPAYNTNIPDLARAQIFLADLKKYEAEGKLPNLILLQLPSNHTNGTSPGASTPAAMVADNDLALGQIVEALSKSKFWPKMAIFVVEDDAQNGVDHVDGHRTTAFVASPYTKRGHIDSTFYSHQSILKSIELILGLPTMSLFDLIAHDMRNSFTGTPDLTPFVAEIPKQDLFVTNPKVSALNGKAKQAAIDSAKMNFAVPDAAPTDRLNRIVWGQIKGWDQTYPDTPRRAFSPLAIETEDEEREEKAVSKRRR
ncbi:MAG: bifunctional YncE family protein/alkaline phosphatase family protein [Acidobacteria bacterium]|nr:bifunctional YncE family protein/alkaline phosphatase family protein [Acidobacteriota bacterium]